MILDAAISPEICTQASRQLKNMETELATEIVARHYENDPQRWAGYGEIGRQHSLQDARYHINYLAEALAVQDIPLFCEYAAWVKNLFAGLPLPEDTLQKSFQFTRDVIQERLAAPQAAAASEYIHAALAYLPQAPNACPSFIKEEQPHYELASKYLELILAAERQKACNLILSTADRGVSIQDIYLNIFQPCQLEIGRLWQTHQISIAQEHYSTAITQTAMALLYPRLFSTHQNGKRLVAACVSGELHEIGIRMVADFFEMEGWHTTYLGANTPARTIPAVLIEQQAHVLAISISLTVHLSALVEMIQIVRTCDECRKIKILVGGHPFNVSPSLWKRVGANGYAADAMSAIRVANQLVGNP
ncbi:MAG: cobalamin-dependent protein [Chloroflexota bacterium]|jgi:methanogenic corrinoid protein MtbC1